MRLGLREIRRAKIRFGLLIGAVGLLVFLIFFTQTLLTNLLGFFTGGLEHQSATVLVYSADARRSLEGSVVRPEQVDQVRAVPGVARAEPLGESTFTTRKQSGTVSDTIIFGYVLGGPGAPTTLSRGRLPRGPGEGVASRIDASNGYGIGSVIEVVPGGAGVAPLPITIVGLADDLRFSVQPTVFTAYETYEAARKVANPDAAVVFPSAVAVTPAPGVAPHTLADEITTSVAGVEALDRATAVASSPGVESVRQSFAVILLLTFLVVTIVTGFFFLILTVQKAAALTLLRAIGAPGRSLVGALMLQVLIVVGGGIAVATALLALASLGSNPTFPISIDPRSVLVSGVIVLALSFVAALVAIRRVLRIEPIEATTRPALGGFA